MPRLRDILGGRAAQSPLAMTLSDRVEQVFGMDPAIERTGLIPNPNDSWNPAKWTAPEWLYSGARAALLPGHVAQGGSWTLEDAANMMIDAGIGAGVVGRKPEGALGAMLWHGGPHKWKPEPGFPHGRPRLDRMGEGEGAQAYGWGFYEAEAPDVARTYRDELAQKITVDGQTVLDMNKMTGTTGNKYIDDLIVAHNGDIDAAIASQKAHMAELEPYQITRGKVDEELAILEGLKDRVDVSNSGTLYKIDAPDEDLARYMDWGAPLSEQPEILAKLQGIDLASPGFDLSTATGGELLRELARAHLKAGAKNPQEMAAKELQSLGIPGLKYFDGMSRGAGDGTRNYVTWDQDILNRRKIVKRNDEVLSSSGPPVVRPQNEADRRRLWQILREGA